eukprot:SAG11_NODE_12_length_27025_cov_37.402681_17_plen_63_part_00
MRSKVSHLARLSPQMNLSILQRVSVVATLGVLLVSWKLGVCSDLVKAFSSDVDIITIVDLSA